VAHLVEKSAVAGVRALCAVARRVAPGIDGW